MSEIEKIIPKEPIAYEIKDEEGNVIATPILKPSLTFQQIMRWNRLGGKYASALDIVEWSEEDQRQLFCIIFNDPILSWYEKMDWDTAMDILARSRESLNMGDNKKKYYIKALGMTEEAYDEMENLIQSLREKELTGIVSQDS